MILTTAIPVYNGAKFITRALTSLYTSEKQPDRVVVLDDGSTDDTCEIVERFKFSCGGWEALELMRFANAGYVGNSNRALELAAETDYLHILHADDEVGRYFYSSAVPAVRRGFGLIFSQPTLMNDATNTITLIPVRRREWDRTEFIKARRDLDHIYYCGTLLRTMRKSRLNLFCEDYPQLCDQVFWAEWVNDAEAGVAEIDPYHCTYHQHESSWTAAQKRDMPALVDEEWRAMLRIQATLDLGKPPRPSKLNFRSRCLFACRSVVKAHEVQYGDWDRSHNAAVEIGRQKAAAVAGEAIKHVGWPIWRLACLVVLLRKKWSEYGNNKTG